MIVGIHSGYGFLHRLRVIRVVTDFWAIIGRTCLNGL